MHPCTFKLDPIDLGFWKLLSKIGRSESVVFINL